MLTAQKQKGLQQVGHTARNQPGTSYREPDRYENESRDYRAGRNTRELYNINFDKAGNAEMFDIKFENTGKNEFENDDKDARNNNEVVYAVVDKSKFGRMRKGTDMLESMQEDSAKALSDLAFYLGGAQNVESHQQKQNADDDDDDDKNVDEDSDDNDNGIDKKNEELKENNPSDGDEQPASKLKVRFVD